MKYKSNFLSSAITMVTLAVLSITGFTLAQQSGIKRTDLQRRDLSAAGREVIQTRIDFDPGARFGKHSHPGEEIIYVLKGTLQYEVEGEAPVTLKEGDVLFIPAGTVHAAKNVGSGIGSELATYVVEKGKPLLLIVEDSPGN